MNNKFLLWRKKLQMKKTQQKERRLYSRKKISLNLDNITKTRGILKHQRNLQNY